MAGGSRISSSHKYVFYYFDKYNACGEKSEKSEKSRLSKLNTMRTRLSARIAFLLASYLGSNSFGVVVAIGHSALVRVARTVVNAVVAPALLAATPLAIGPAHAISGAATQTPSPDSPHRQQWHLVSPPAPSNSSTENYLPRRLYPGTYKNYCGPTPEVKVGGGCAAHGRYGDAPADAVDAACRLHDVSYCNCESQLLSRRRAARPAERSEYDDDDGGFPLLSSLTALRFVTKPALERSGLADATYFDCVSGADRRLVAAGVRLRAEQQRTGCSTDPSLAWFCDFGKGRGTTLTAFENVNVRIFLRDLDADERAGDPPARRRIALSRSRAERGGGEGTDLGNGESLSRLEWRREVDLRREVRRGKTIADAASSGTVEAVDEKMLRKLSVDGDDVDYESKL